MTPFLILCECTSTSYECNQEQEYSLLIIGQPVASKNIAANDHSKFQFFNTILELNAWGWFLVVD